RCAAEAAGRPSAPRPGRAGRGARRAGDRVRRGLLPFVSTITSQPHSSGGRAMRSRRGRTAAHLVRDTLKTATSLPDLMRESPLVARRGRRANPPRARLWGKLELALAGAMKDRVALHIIEEAERSGELRPGGVIAESSSGTMAEGLARVGALKGYRV